MNKSTSCHIVSVGKRRDGGTRYWCLEHRADATAKYGRRAKKCRYAHVPPLTPADILALDISKYSGGIALWGAVAPVYDTTRLPLDHGVHVHARPEVDGSKEIDATYRSVSLVGHNAASNVPPISELDAIYYMVSSIFGYSTKYVACTLCHHPHLDKDWFSVHAHQRHLCAGCGKHFRDTERAIGNPIRGVQELICPTRHVTVPAVKKLDIAQSEYPGGMQIWGSNPAIVWTANRSEEEGIHIHAFKKLGESTDEDLDDTFSAVVVDGVQLDPLMVRTLMAQSALPHIVERVTSINCPECGEPHFDDGSHSFTPHEKHTCVECGLVFKARSRLRHTMGNPALDMFARLSEMAPREQQHHESTLLPETI